MANTKGNPVHRGTDLPSKDCSGREAKECTLFRFGSGIGGCWQTPVSKETRLVLEILPTNAASSNILLHARIYPVELHSSYSHRFTTFSHSQERNDDALATTMETVSIGCNFQSTTGKEKIPIAENTLDITEARSIPKKFLAINTLTSVYSG